MYSYGGALAKTFVQHRWLCQDSRCTLPAAMFPRWKYYKLYEDNRIKRQDIPSNFSTMGDVRHLLLLTAKDNGDFQVVRLDQTRIQSCWELEPEMQRRQYECSCRCWKQSIPQYDRSWALLSKRVEGWWDLDYILISLELVKRTYSPFDCFARVLNSHTTSTGISSTTKKVHRSEYTPVSMISSWRTLARLHYDWVTRLLI